MVTVARFTGKHAPSVSSIVWLRCSSRLKCRLARRLLELDDLVVIHRVVDVVAAGGEGAVDGQLQVDFQRLACGEFVGVDADGGSEGEAFEA